MSFGNSQTQGFNNSSQVTTNKIVVFGPDQGIFVYSGTPALGNLIASLGVETGGTDSVGNAYMAGDSSYVNAGLGVYFASNTDGAALTWNESAAGPGGPYTLIASIGFNFSGGTGHLVVDSTDGVSMEFNNPDTGNTKLIIPQGRPTASIAAIIAAGTNAGIWD